MSEPCEACEGTRFKTVQKGVKYQCRSCGAIRLRDGKVVFNPERDEVLEIADADRRG